MAYTGRHPSVTDAWPLGYTTGVREDCSFQIDSYPNVSLPVLFLDNNFHDPDLDRFLDRVDRYNPEVAVIGDVYSQGEASRLQTVSDDLENIEPVIVPKCREALDEIADDTVVGYANGYSDIKPEDFSKPREWRGRRVHLLGGSPSTQ